MIHVLICPHTLDYGGSQLGIYHWGRYLDKSRFKVSILAMKKGGLSEKFERHFQVFYDDMGYPNVEKYIRKIQPDMLHACPPGGVKMAYIDTATKLLPVTQTVMCPRSVSKGNPGVSRSVVLSKYVYSLQDSTVDIDQIDLPFDQKDYDIQYDRDYFGLPKDKIIVGSLGNQRKENAHFMELAWKYKDENVHFVIKSNFKPRKYALYKLKYLFARKRVTIINRFMDENEKMSLFHCMDIFLYPTSNEAYGLVFLEAMSQKVPIISYKDSAMPDVIGEGGLLSPLNDKAGLTKHLEYLVANKAVRESMGEKGYRLVVDRNDPKRIAEQYEKIFLTVYEKKKG